VALLGLASLAIFSVSPGHPVVEFSRFHFGTLPPGAYPRFALTFLNANLLCNYLTVSLGLLLLASLRGWLPRRAVLALAAAVLIAATFTISPGLGGIALALGLWAWISQRRRSPRLASLALWAAAATAIAFLAVTAVTPIIHSTAPFVMAVPGTAIGLAPSGRFMAWSAAAAEFARHPLLGHGIGISAVRVDYADPSGNRQTLTDAHNLVLSIAAQAGIVGLAGLAALIGLVVRTISRAWPGSAPANLTVVILGLTLLNALVYQGVSGSFEDARHLWLLLGLLLAAARLSRANGAETANPR
jgi:O-antigen ligase